MANLPTLIDSYEPVATWLFASKADAALMGKHLMSYPDKLMRNHFREPRDGIPAVRNRLQSDQECRNLVFANLQNVTDLNAGLRRAELIHLAVARGFVDVAPGFLPNWSLI